MLGASVGASFCRSRMVSSVRMCACTSIVRGFAIVLLSRSLCLTPGLYEVWRASSSGHGGPALPGSRLLVALAGNVLCSVPMKNEVLRIGVAGLGAVGREVARRLEAGIPGLALAAVSVRDLEKARKHLPQV